jgi:hypothetical protein
MRKTIIVLATIMLLVSCESSKKYKYQIEVTYTTGEKDTLSVTTTEYKGKKLFMDSGCVYKVKKHSKYEPNYQGCVVCGVRKYRFL